ncbi:Probable RNA-directed DNA polymerase from transposon BS [Eumeta japonica]|uniref:Probable RNA-directed DNA polymerase from transposon BS n=1 Tax=Eumeta variegata TaxID=151549 RepID=A0A4C2A629_EUMVA|nr:Probable RNA-directed DNA polymerase from transposon BS [Eumeta japonica]
MNRRDGTEMGLVLAILHKSGTAKDIFKFSLRVCGLSGITVEAPYKSGPGQCFCCQIYGHAAQNCYTQPAVSNAANLMRQRMQTHQRLWRHLRMRKSSSQLHRLPKAPILKIQQVIKGTSKPSAPAISNKTSLPWPGKPCEQPVMSPAVSRSLPSQTHGSEHPRGSNLNRLRRLSESPPSRPQPNRRQPLPQKYWCCNTTNASGRTLATLAEDHELAIIAPPTPTHLPANVRHRPEILDLAVLKGVVLNLSSIETLHCLGSDHLPVLLKLDSFTVFNNDVDTAIGALQHIRPVVKRCQRKVPANSDRRGLSADIHELIRAKNAALRRASAYPTPEYRFRAQTLHCEVKTRVREVKTITGARNGRNHSIHKAYWVVAKALKFNVWWPCLPSKTGSFDDQEKAEYIADSIELQCSLDPPTSSTETVTKRNPLVVFVTTQKRSTVGLGRRGPKLIKELKPRKAPGLYGVNNKAINCHFPEVWKEVVIIGIPKPGKPRDLPTSYRPISLLSGLGKLFEKVLESRFSDHLLGNGLIINEQFGFRSNHFCPQQALRLVEHISEGFKCKCKTVAVFFDVAKAFDKVWHAGLIYKLHLLQVSDRLVIIIHQYLTNRHFFFRHENSTSAKRLIRPGVLKAPHSPAAPAYTNDIPAPANRRPTPRSCAITQP